MCTWKCKPVVRCDVELLETYTGWARTYNGFTGEDLMHASFCQSGVASLQLFHRDHGSCYCLCPVAKDPRAGEQWHQMCRVGAGWTAVPADGQLWGAAAPQLRHVQPHCSCAHAGMLLLTHGTHQHLRRVCACLAGALHTPSDLVHRVRRWRKHRLCGNCASAAASSRLCLPRLWLAAVDHLHSSERFWHVAPAMHAVRVSRLCCTPRTYLPGL